MDEETRGLKREWKDQEAIHRKERDEIFNLDLTKRMERANRRRTATFTWSWDRKVAVRRSVAFALLGLILFYFGSWFRLIGAYFTYCAIRYGWLAFFSDDFAIDRKFYGQGP